MGKLFQKSDLPIDVMLTDAGIRQERPFQILGLLETLAFGDLILNVVFLSTLADQFDYARLHVKFRDARPYAKDIISLSPWIDVAEPCVDARQWFGLARQPYPCMVVGSQKGKNRPVYDMVVTSHMAQRELVHSLPNPVTLSLPEHRVGDLRNRLVELGISPDRWFAVFHYRESSYEYRIEGSDRDSDAKTFDCLVDDIIEQGGQAVRLGHIGMTPFRARPGFVDITGESTLVQAAATTFSRFMIAGPSGACALALAFHVPATIVDAVDTLGMWGPVDVLTHTVTTPDRQFLRNQSLKDSGLLNSNILAARIKQDPRISVSKATVEDLREVAKRLFNRTTDCTGWRIPKARVTPNRRNAIEWPLRPTDTMTWVDI
jgi:putative glycosyltransferase (TIGR04372 family)